MLKKFLIAMALAMASISCAYGQGQFQPGQVFGNPNAGAGQGLPSSVSAILDRALGSTRGAIIERGASGWAIVGPGSTAGVPFVSGGAGADPSYQLLGVVGGGTGINSATLNGVLYGGGGTSPLGVTAAGTNGQIMLGVTGSPPQMATMSQDCTITNAGVVTCTKTNNVAFGSLATLVPGTGVATALGVNVGTAGAFVVNGGALGTPSSGTLTSATGLPISTGVSGLGTGVATALGVNTGTAGAFVVNGGALGTPSSGTLTSATGLPISTGVSGLGTGIATALGINIGTTGSPVTLNGNLGTPSGGNGSNITALNASNVTSGNLPDAQMPNTAWSAFTASPSCGTATITTTAARFKTWGKVTHFNLDITFTAIGTCTSVLQFTLPNTPNSSASAVAREGGVSSKAVVCSITSGSTTANCTMGDASNFLVNYRPILSGVYENQ